MSVRLEMSANEIDNGADLVGPVLEPLGLAAIGFDLGQQPVHPLDHTVNLLKPSLRFVAGSSQA